MNYFQNDLLLLLPEFFLVFFIVSFLLVGTFLTSNFRLILLDRFSYVFLFFLVLLGLTYYCLPETDFLLLNFQFISDSLSLFMKFFTIGLLFFIVYTTVNYLFFEKVFFIEYYFFVGLLLITAFFLISTVDFFLFYLVIELQALILYTMAAIKRYNVFSAESGLKYFVLGAFSSGLLLYGISLLYGFLGFLNFYDIKFVFFNWLDTSSFFGIHLALIFILSSLMFKLSMAPFHIWVPDVYDGAPTSSVFFFVTLPKLAIFIFLFRLYTYLLIEFSELWYTLLFFSGLLSVLWGTFAALNQFSIKRLYAYSSIVNIGYLAMALSYGTSENLVVVFYYLVVYIILSALLFSFIIGVGNLRGFETGKSLFDYKTLFSYNFFFSIFFALIFFSFAGIPPLSGFFIKFFLFKVMFLGDFLLNPAFFVIFFVSTISAFYYIRVVRFIYFSGNKRFPDFFVVLSPFLVFTIIFSITTFVILFFLFSELFFIKFTFFINFLFF
jgi:NADH:ubiquinone oxidoreductase subunit 2 (chain N)